VKKTAIVTGATSGIGRACVRQLCELGWGVVGIGRRRERLDELTDELEGFIGVEADLASEDAGEVISRCLRALGEERLNLLVNNAGILKAGSLEETSMALYDEMMHINVRAPFALTRAALPALRLAAPAASVVNVSSVAGLRPYSGLSVYCVSKAALDHMTRCLAMELASEQIRVNAVNPGVVVTELHRQGGMSEEQYSAFLERSATTHPIGRVGRPEEIASLILYLAGEQAGWITGETISIDGGRHLTSAR